MNVETLEFDGSKIPSYLPTDKNLSQLAKEVGVTRQAMHDIVKGRRKPSADLMVKIVAVLNIQLSDLSNKNFSQLSANSEIFV